MAVNRVHSLTKTLSGSNQRLRELKRINCKYKTKILPHAYYGFSRAEYETKSDKNIFDYLHLIVYLLLSYQNIIYYIRNYDKKIINGVLPKANMLLSCAHIKMPRLNYTKFNIQLSSPKELNQEVDIYCNDVFLGKYIFQ